MPREIQKVRKVGNTLVVTLAQSLLEGVPLKEGDKVLVETLGSRKLIVTKESYPGPSSSRTEIELEILEKRIAAKNSELSSSQSQWNNSNYYDIPDDSADFEVHMAILRHDRDKLDVDLAQKRLELFDLQG
jgi:antitoxin component of MazEF toxin-antitoxin module